MFRYSGHDGWPLSASTVGNAGPDVVLMHGGGPDHRSLLPLADRLADRCRVVLPDVRGYGMSRCADPARHTWARYAEDVVALLDHLGTERAVVGGTGLGATVAARALLARPDRFTAGILISVEDIEDDAAKRAETAMMDAFAATVTAAGIEAAWAPILPELAPVIETLVREAIPRSDPASIAAAAAIGRDRSFRSPAELAAIAAPVLLFPGIDQRHPTALARELARILPDARLGPGFGAEMRTADDLADAVAPAIREFLAAVPAG
ncbi:alpha/beta fold hydrolase [Nocardia mexicana]|uniref:Pimeloyl-ACP methyl ester carboxylesterase n=1 Tax=Nocardia mexicana TaxID=279262 RepID=A0A370H2D7_9NOCA|nr:alpha/beta hydrolase [Nocardia mexicana]RDI49997.1 pimeloyl-ACP methyl ester carboxylesterase [Nocardia mexicana]